MEQGRPSLLQRLFSQKVIVKRMPSGRLRTIDYDKLQSSGSPFRTMRSGVKSNLAKNMAVNSVNPYYSNSGYSTNSQVAEIDAIRNAMYKDYEVMESDPIIAAALDIYADEATVKNAHGQMLVINTDNDQVKAVLHNLYFDILNINFNLWHWIRSLAKNGDLFVALISEPQLGVLDAVPMHPSVITRNDAAGPTQSETEYWYTGETTNMPFLPRSVDNRVVFKYHEMAHFRILTDTSFLPYGKSMLEGARTVFKQLQMMEDAMLIHRIMRAPARYIYKIGVGNLPQESIDGYMEDVANSIKKIPYKDPVTGEYNLKFNLMNMLEDVFIPTRGQDDGTDISELAGLASPGTLEDIQYLQRKELAYLKIPRAYLGYDEAVEGKGTLAAEDIKFARMIERLQQIAGSELEKIGQIHLMLQGFDVDDATDFTISLSTPSLIYERQKVDLLNEKVNLVQNMLEQKLFSKQWIYENVFSLSPDEWKQQQDMVLEDLKRFFREEQIKTEGNDPAVTGISRGTPHDIVSMQVASRAIPDESQLKLWNKEEDGRKDNPGRPKEHGSWESEEDPSLGRDPTGRLAMQTKLNAGRDLKSLMSSIKGVQTLMDNKQDDEISNISMLNEDLLLDDSV